MLNVNVGDAPAELRAAVLAMKRADSEVRKGVANRMRESMTPAWRSELSKHVGSTANESRILPSNARITGGNPPQLVTAASKRKFGNGLVPDKHWAGYEYGANRSTTRAVTSSRGKKYKRHVMNHLPARRKPGRVIEPAVADILPRVAAFWTQSVVKSFMDAAEGR